MDSNVKTILVEHCLFADDALYDVENNTWVKIQGDAAIVGVTSILSWLTGKLSSVTFKETGSHIIKGSSLGSVEGPKHFEVVRSPLTGILNTVNTELLKKPWLINEDPYGVGWFAKIVPQNLSQEMSGLLDIGAAKEMIQERIRELRVHCYTAFPDYEMYEIGAECSAVLTKLNQALAKSPVGTIVLVVSDEPTADVEMIRWSKQTGHALLDVRVEGNLHHYLVKKLV